MLVMVADDDEQITQLVCRWLETENEPCIRVHTLMKAAETLVSEPVERVILDWRWRLSPGSAPMCIYEMCKQRDIPVVILTANPENPTLPKDATIIPKLPVDTTRERLMGWLKGVEV